MRRRGFTLFEMSVVLVVLVLIASFAVPRLVALQRGQEARDFLRGLEDIARRAREEAISSGIAHVLRYDDTVPEVVLTAQRDDEEDQAITTVLVPQGFEVSRFVAEDDDMGSGEWELTFYPDGASDGGGLEIESGQTVYALEIRAKGGKVDLIEGELPPAGSESWDAGDHEQRQ